MSEQNDCLLLAVGDVYIERPVPGEALQLVSPIFHTGDVVFGNNECVYSGRGVRNPVAPGAHRADPQTSAALGEAGFTVMSCANNHMPDFGADAMEDTINALHAAGILTTGAGATLADARTPAIRTVGETSIGFLAYACVFPPGYDANEERAGVAPLFAHTVYQLVDVGQPGTTPRIHTFADRDSLAVLREDVASLKAKVDLVVVSIHWGIHFTPALLADYEHELAVAAIDEGADLVLGHHQHIVKGIDTYRGKVIFHGLGNFVGDLPNIRSVVGKEIMRVMDEHYNYAVKSDADYPTYPYHPDCRITMIAGCVIRDGRIAEVGYLPCLVNTKGQPAPLERGDPEWQRVVDYVEKVTRDARLETPFGPAQSLGDSWISVGITDEQSQEMNAARMAVSQ